MTDYTVLGANDLIPNEPLKAGPNAQISDDDDWFRHRKIARRVAQLIAAPGSNVNIAVNAPWGAGKSSFFALLKEELATFKDDKGESSFNTVDFDAWQMADDTFESNFLATVADGVPNSPKDIEQQLFRANRTVNLPFGIDISKSIAAKITVVVVLSLIAILVGWVAISEAFLDPTVSTAADKGDWGPFWPTLAGKLLGVLSVTAGGTVLFVLITALLNLKKVTVHESGPAHVTQFRNLFQSILDETTATQVILVDELDRCAPEAVMRTLEGLRRFLGAERCIFVVAFDRESVVETVNTQLERKIPSRPGRPYYSTAGEYLDKIFTYQVALPPQPRKAFRKYAKQLVNAKGNVGVWGELTASGPERLERVLSILSPPHLTSPRRTKVLLNDFAINARVVEAYDGTWVGRADEIAVLTVLQTEFPLFYADVEHYPNLLLHVAGRAPNEPGESLKELVGQYKDNTAPVETVLSKRQSKPRIALGNQLKRYLEKLQDMQVTLPRADLVQLGAGKQMLEFEDPSVFATVEAATEVPREETLAALRSASADDRLRAVDIMLAESEGESNAEATTLRIISGTLLPELTSEQQETLMPRVNSAWSRIAGSASITQLTESALRGFVMALGPTSDERWALHVLRATHSNVDLHSPAVQHIAESATDEAVIGSRAMLIKNAAEVLPEQTAPLLGVLRRLDAANAPELEPSFAKLLTEHLDTEPIEENDEPGLQAVADLVTELQDLIAALPPQSMVRDWLVGIFRARALESETPDSDYLRILTSAPASDEERTVIAQEALRTLALNSSVPLRLRLTSIVAENADAAPDAELVIPALRVLLGLIADDTHDEDDTLTSVIEQLTTWAASTSSLTPDVVVPVIEAAFTGDASMTRRRYDTLLTVGHALARDTTLTDAMEPLIATLAVSNVVGVPDTTERVHVLQGLRTESPAILRRVAADLLDELPGANGRRKWIVDAALCVDHHLLNAGASIDALPAELVQPYFAQNVEPEALYRWIETGPSASDVTTAVGATPLRSIPASSWHLYAANATTPDATALWVAGVDARERLTRLEALASLGVEQPARERAARRLLTAPNSSRRMEALRFFSTLPPDAGTAAAVLPALIEWVNAGYKGEAREVFDMLMRHRDFLDKDALTQLKTAVPTWLAKVHTKLRPGSRESLVAAGYVRREPAKGRRRRR